MNVRDELLELWKSLRAHNDALKGMSEVMERSLERYRKHTELMQEMEVRLRALEQVVEEREHI